MWDEEEDLCLSIEDDHNRMWKPHKEKDRVLVGSMPGLHPSIHGGGGDATTDYVLCVRRSTQNVLYGDEGTHE